MSEYEATDPETGRIVTFEWNGGSEPTQDDMPDVFRAARLSEKPPKKSFGGFVKNIGSDIWDTAKGLGDIIARGPVNLAGDLGRLIVGGSEAAQRGLGLLPSDYPETPYAAAAKSLVKPITESFENPSGIPGRLMDYAYEKPFSTAMNLSTGLGLAGKVAELSGGVRAASALSRASEYTNPITLASKAVTAPLNAIANSKIPEGIYESTMKVPPASLSAEERARVLNTLVRDEKLPLNSKTVTKINATVGEIEADVRNAVNLATDADAEADVTKIMSAMDDLKPKYANRPDSTKYYKAIDRAKEDIAQHEFVRQVGASKMEGFTVDHPPGDPGYKLVDTVKDASFSSEKIPLNKALDLKKGIYDEIQSYYMKGQKPETGRIGIKNDIDARSKAEAAKVLRQEVLDSPEIPDTIKESMKREAGLMNARKWVERATNRSGNTDLISIGGFLFGALTGHGIPSAVAYKVATSQRLLSNFAISAAKARAPISPDMANVLFQLSQGAGQIPERPPF